jgi:hypothetical protein
MKACVLISYEAKEGVRAYDTFLWGDVVWVQQGIPKIVFPSELVWSRSLMYEVFDLTNVL